jgi:hypothetical protein
LVFIRARYTGRFGRWTFAEGMDRSVCTELVVHGWDPARATSQDDRIDRIEIEQVRALLAIVGHDVVRGMMAGASLIGMEVLGLEAAHRTCNGTDNRYRSVR